MKKILLLLTVFSMVFTSCDPLEDIYEEVEGRDIAGEVIYTLTEDDYDTLEFDNRYFSSEDEAKSLLPNFLSEKYPLWGKGSTASVLYKIEMLGGYTSAASYELKEEDYASAGIDAATYSVFTAASPADSNLPTILKTNIDAPASGDIVLVKYKYAEEPNDPSVIYTMASEDYQIVVDAVVNNPDPAISSLVSSYGDSETYTGASVYFSNFDTRLYNREGQAAYDALTTDEERVAFVDAKVQEGIVWFLQGKFPNAKPEVNGQTVFYAISYKTYNGVNGEPTVVYKCTAAGDVPEFELVEGPGEDVSLQVSTITEDRADFYTFDGSAWGVSEGVYYLSDADFESMGENSGQPGRYNNFSSSIAPNDYLPTFLKGKFPYAQEGDVFSLVYRYFDDGAILKGSTYSYSNGVWGDLNYTIDFSHDGSIWAPATKYELVDADYTLIADTYRAVEGYESVVANLESYGNISTYNWEDEQIDAAVNTVLKTRFPDAQEGQNFDVIVFVYNGSSQNVTFNYTLSSGVYIRR
jgi:hypothetical protein